jgi:polyisoprenoid-binding protein YceI
MKLPLILALAAAVAICASAAFSAAGKSAGAGRQWDWTGTAQKWVPIFSIDNVGVNIGAAQIAGPRGQVEKVKGVAELGLTFKGLARVYVYIPVSSISTKLDRVQGVSVWAVGGVELVNF